MTLQVSMELIATLACAIFAGAAIYISMVEHPARMSCGTELAATEWGPSYKRATWIQAPLALIAFACSFAAWFAGSNVWWLVGGFMLGLLVPYTLIVIMPTNHRLESSRLDKRSDEALRLLHRWGMLHTVRTIVSFVALIIFLLNR
ncbi:MAG TPA: DUF1772 domain-containing protein [Blastocatellia bacterium]|nr:DUF1772 domain-containing protein [Blastocatellia bacterium]